MTLSSSSVVEPGRGAIAVHIDEVEIGLRLKSLFFGGGVDFDHGDDNSAFRQFLNAAANGGKGGFVADQQIPVIGGGDDHGAARAANDEGLARGSGCRPA